MKVFNKKTLKYKPAKLLWLLPIFSLLLCFLVINPTYAEDTTQTQPTPAKTNLLSLTPESPQKYVAFTYDVFQGVVNNQTKPIEANSQLSTIQIQDSFLLPLRFISEVFPVECDWDAAENSAIIKNGTDIYQFKANQNSYLLNGQAITYTGTPPTMHKNRIFMPMRLLGETVLGCNVAWENNVALVYNKDLTFNSQDVSQIKDLLLTGKKIIPPTSPSVDEEQSNNKPDTTPETPGTTPETPIEKPTDTIPKMPNFDYTQKVTYNTMMVYLNLLEKTYPDLISLEIAGKSFEDRDIPLVKLGKGERYIYMDASAHARENITTNYILKVITTYADGYYNNGHLDGYSYTEILDKFTFVILPCFNPDGVNIALHGFDKAKNPAAVKAMFQKGKNFNYWKSTANGVDINRNFPVDWAKHSAKSSVKRQASESYAGKSAGSEPETQTIMKVARMYPYEAFLSFHIAGEIIYMKDIYYSPAAQAEATALGKKLCAYTGYAPASLSTGAGFSNWARCNFQKPALTIELLPPQRVYPFSYSIFESQVWQKVRAVPLVAANYLK